MATRNDISDDDMAGEECSCHAPMCADELTFVDVGLDSAPNGCQKSRSVRPTLPRIVRFLGIDESPGSSCPHCGATGRYILRFQVEDGRTLAAMRGCAKLFPQSRIANEELRLVKKQADRAKLGWSLNQDDTRALLAIERFYAGLNDERAALAAVDSAKARNQIRARR